MLQVLRLHSAIGPLLGAFILSFMADPNDPENYRPILYMEAVCRLIPLLFILRFVPAGLGVVRPHDGANGSKVGLSRQRACYFLGSGGVLRRHGSSVLAASVWTALLFAITKCWTRYAVPLRARELGINQVELSLAQSLEMATAIPAQIAFGLLAQRSVNGLRLAACANGLLWGVALVLIAVWAKPNDAPSFYATHVVYGVGYGANVVEEIVRATKAPAVGDGAAEWLAAVHTAKDIFNIWLPPTLGYLADTSSVSVVSVGCACAGLALAVFCWFWIGQTVGLKGRLKGSATILNSWTASSKEGRPLAVRQTGITMP
jgi:hypothetical protein